MKSKAEFWPWSGVLGDYIISQLTFGAGPNPGKCSATELNPQF